MSAIHSLVKAIQPLSVIITPDLGLVVILLSLASLLIQKTVYGRKIALPGHFFLLYGLGALILFLSEVIYNPQDVSRAVLELLAALFGFYFYATQ
jgi:predicted membrane channel-forming protein YqfA (hemolysin III family)